MTRNSSSTSVVEIQEQLPRRMPEIQNTTKTEPRIEKRKVAPGIAKPFLSVQYPGHQEYVFPGIGTYVIARVATQGKVVAGYDDQELERENLATLVSKDSEKETGDVLSVSRNRHLQIVISSEYVVFLSDMNSANGTKVDGAALQKTLQLPEGEHKLALGNANFIVRYEK